MAKFDELTPKYYAELYEADNAARKRMTKRQRYYNGFHDILERDDSVGIDGEQKSARVANFIKFGIDMFVGSIVGEPILVTAEQKLDDSESENINESPSIYKEIAKDNSFDIADVTNTRNAYIAGVGVETFEYNDGTVQVTAQDPATFSHIYDSDGTHIGSIHQSIVKAGEFYDGDLQKNDLTIMVVYTDKNYLVYTLDSGSKKNEWKQDEEKSTSHEFGAVPVNLWHINEDYVSHISDDVISQQDEYNEIDSQSGDDLRYDSDGLLAVKGFSIQQLQDNAETIRRLKMLPLPSDGDASFIKKDTDTLRTDSRINRTRQHIFMGLGVPDVNEIVGATGSTSGIALGLKFKPMQDSAKSMIANLRDSVRGRIDLINAVISKSNGDQITDVRVNIEFDLPHNRVEEWQNIGNLSSIVSKQTQLELMSDIDDPDTEIKRLTKESEANRIIARGEGTPDQIVARNDAEIKDLAVELQPKLANTIDAVADAALAEVIKRQGTPPASGE